jgi:hypothetical protein
MFFLVKVLMLFYLFINFYTKKMEKGKDYDLEIDENIDKEFKKLCRQTTMSAIICKFDFNK